MKFGYLFFNKVENTDNLEWHGISIDMIYEYSLHIDDAVRNQCLALAFLGIWWTGVIIYRLKKREDTTTRDYIIASVLHGLLYAVVILAQLFFDMLAYFHWLTDREALGGYFLVVAITIFLFWRFLKTHKKYNI